MKWIAAELHTHTCHSDGTFTTQGLCDAAKAAGLSAIAITDHNTTAPLLELQPGRPDGAVAVIRGIEWTTFWGHLCILGGTLDVDWRDASPENMPLKLKDIRKSGGICAIAYPFAVGSPMCTGCHWSFGITDFSDITYLEAWSEQFPCVRCECRRAVDFWVGLLDRGYRIAITYGRDWHGEDMQLLRQYRAWQSSERLRLGEYYQDQGFVFSQDTGNPMHPDSVNDWLGKFSKRHGLPHINPHAFRHSMASILLYNHIENVSVSKRLGHSSVSFTENVYAHVIAEADQRNADMLADVFLKKA